MSAREMTPTERIEAAITLNQPDRIPICPQIDYLAATVAGKTCAEFASSIETADECIDIAFEKLGGWDWLYNPTGTLLFIKTFPMEISAPGKELPDHSAHQVVEKPLMFEEDYDYIIEHGYKSYKHLIMTRLNKLADYQEALSHSDKVMKCYQKWHDRGIPIQSAYMQLVPFEYFCLHRTFNEFVKDMYKIPEKIIAASDAMSEEITSDIRKKCDKMNNHNFWLGVWRASASFISPKQFEKFVHPYMKHISLELIQEGYRPIFHLDGNMAPMLDFFTEYPKGTCVMALDGFTDIRKAKKVVGDNMCIMGDVPPTLLAIGTEAEVAQYCKSLIEDIAPGGGFIMGSGCTVPVNAKYENVKTMIETTKKYGKY